MTVLMMARGRFFGAAPALELREVLVDLDDQTVRVYDPVARTHTRCHSLTPAAIRRIVRAARRHAARA